MAAGPRPRVQCSAHQDLPDADRPQPARPRLRQGMVGDPAAGGRRDAAVPDRHRARPSRMDAIDRMVYDTASRPTTRWWRPRWTPSARSRSPSAPTRRLSPTPPPCNWIPANDQAERRQGLRPALGEDAARRHPRHLHLRRLPRGGAAAAGGRGGRGGARPLAFAGGCPESADVSVSALADEWVLLYEDFVHGGGFLRDVTLAPLTDLPTATANLKDLASADSALKRLLVAVVAEVDSSARPARAAPRATAARPRAPRRSSATSESSASWPRRARSTCRPAARPPSSTPPARRSPTISSRSAAPSPRSTACRRRSTPPWPR